MEDQKYGILIFYVNVGNMPFDEVEKFIDNNILATEDIQGWTKLFIPIRLGDSYVQVIRNETTGKDDITIKHIDELQTLLCDFLKPTEEMINETGPDIPTD